MKRKHTRQELYALYIQLREDIIVIRDLEDIADKHHNLRLADKRFEELCARKYNKYFPIGPVYEDPLLLTHNHNVYLMSRCNKMINDINDIVFYLQD